MNTVIIIRKLWRLRIAVAVIAVLAIAAGLFISYDVPSMKSRKYTVGVGSARILVDTPASQVVDLSPEGSDSVGERAALLSSLMVDGEIKDSIAQEAGLKPDQLLGIDQNGGSPADSGDTTPGRNRYVLAPEVTMISSSTWLPIIQLSTQAPTRAGAETLANAAIKGLTRYLDSKAASEAIPGAKRLRVSGLGAAQATDETRGPSLAFSLIATIALFALGCALLFGVTELVSALRQGSVPTESATEPVVPDLAVTAAARRQEPTDVSPPAQLYELDKRREELRVEEQEPVTDKKQAAAAGAKAPPKAGDRAGWWSGGPS